jgi:hypothetical protein
LTARLSLHSGVSSKGLFDFHGGIVEALANPLKVS